MPEIWKPWTPEELRILRENAGKLSAAELATLIGRSKHATEKKLQMNRLASFHLWPADRLEDLRANSSSYTTAEFAEKHGISPEAARKMARKLGVKLARTRRADEWPLELIERLRALAPTHTSPQIAALIGKSHSAVKNKAHELGFRCKYPSRVRTPVDQQCPHCSKYFTLNQLHKHRGSCARRHEKVAKVVAAKDPAVRGPKPRLQKVAPPKPRKVAVEVSLIHHCPKCSAPVSNQQQHFERMPQCRPQPTTAPRLWAVA